MQMSQLQQMNSSDSKPNNRLYIAPIKKYPTYTSTHLNDSVNDRSITLLLFINNFIFMNVARLIILIKRKSKILSDSCDKSTLFFCLCETLLNEGILDSEII